MTAPSDLAFIDTEASGLPHGTPTYPIEIGWAWPDGTTESHLIRPHAKWNAWLWSEESARIHGISREQLVAEGQEVAWVAQRFIDVLGDKIICSDNVQYEAYWIAVLFDAAMIPLPKFKYLDSQIAVQTAFMVRGVSLQRAAQIEEDVRRRYPHLHRAAPDALYWAMLYKAATNLSVD